MAGFKHERKKREKNPNLVRLVLFPDNFLDCEMTTAQEFLMRLGFPLKTTVKRAALGHDLSVTEVFGRRLYFVIVEGFSNRNDFVFR